MFSLVKSFVVLTLLAGVMTACYRMPTEDDYSLIPYTNNPDYTKCKAGSGGNPSPGIGY